MVMEELTKEEAREVLGDMCRLGFHQQDDMERSWPVPNPEGVYFLHCLRCQRVINHGHYSHDVVAGGS